MANLSYDIVNPCPPGFKLSVVLYYLYKSKKTSEKNKNKMLES